MNREINAIPAQIAAHQDHTSRSENVPRFEKPANAAKPKRMIRAISTPLLVLFHAHADVSPATNRTNARIIPPPALVSDELSSMAFTTPVAQDWNVMITNTTQEIMPDTNFQIFIMIQI